MLALTGKRPRSVSAPSRNASVPSSTAFATSVASARVGRGLTSIVSTMRVMITGLPANSNTCNSQSCEVQKDAPR